MFFDTKSVLLAALLGLLAAPANAQAKFPFNVERDANGAVTRIELPVRDSMLSEDEDVLTDLRVSLKDYQDSGVVGLTALSTDEIVPENEQDRKTYEQAKAYLKNELSINTVQDPRLDKEYAKAKSKILTIKLYRLLAAPNSPEAFDGEELLTEAVKKLVSEAGNALDISSPVFGVFKFLVGQYLESLQQRREFFQNQLLVLLDNDKTGQFTEKEKSAIRSSIYYSRLSFKSVPKRVSARKNWAAYGDAQLTSALSPCKNFVGVGENGFGSCFKQTGSAFVNRMVKKSSISKSVSLAFDSKKPTRVRDFRILLTLSKLGLSMISVPSIVKKPLATWLDSQYEPQRISEGFFYGHAVLKGQTDLADWILTGTANPIIRR